jgi:Uma2 family endonuclease
MHDRNPKRYAPGPMTVYQLQEGERYELHEGRPVYVAPTGSDGARGALVGGHVIDTDPQVKIAGLDGGFALDAKTLRAPDIAVGDMPDAPGWIEGAPVLAVEYASTGQDEAQLQLKIKELLRAGTQFVWVVRLIGVRRVEIHEPGRPMRVAHVGEDLLAPGVLQNPIPVQAMFDRQMAHDLTLRNLLQRKGYRDLDAVREESHEQGRRRGEEEGRLRGYEQGRAQTLREALHTILLARGLGLAPAEAERIASCHDAEQLERWLRRAATAHTAAEVLA